MDEKEADAHTHKKPPDPPDGNQTNNHSNTILHTPQSTLYNESISYPDYKIVIQSKHIDNIPQFLCSQKVGKSLAHHCKCDKESIVDINRVSRSKLVITVKSAKLANAIVQNPNIKTLYNAFIPAAYTCRYAIAKGINIDFSDKELKQNIDTRQHKLINIQRLNRRKINENGEVEYVKCQTVRLLFEGPDIPQHILLYFNRIQCEPSIMPVRQCQNCFRFGHISKYCRGTKKCRMCAAESDPNHQCSKNPHCINCKDNHIATSPDCKELTKQKNIKKMMSVRRVLYHEALQTFSTNESNKYAIATNNRFESLTQDSDFPSLPTKHGNENIQAYIPSPDFLKIPFAMSNRKTSPNPFSIKKKGPTDSKEPAPKRTKNTHTQDNKPNPPVLQNKPLLGVSYGKNTSSQNKTNGSKSTNSSTKATSNETFNFTDESQHTQSSDWLLGGNKLFHDDSAQTNFQKDLTKSIKNIPKSPVISDTEMEENESNNI
ncbi:hypothetical protein M8J76_000147 [Diaphorina citri]|nr:hypothetical protein M8J75_001419 [Diaphorina citri]KAI5748557.1 hypothetical protein M8J76_000147 [Diaphorina citri]